jgi:6-phosphogluconolactonase
MRLRSLISVTLVVVGCSGGSGGAGGHGGAAGASGTTGGASAGTGGGTGGASAGTGGGAGTSSAGTGGGSAGSNAGTGGGTGGGAGEVAVYVSGSSSTISIFALDLATGALTARGTAAGGSSPTYLAFAPSNRFVYAGNGGQGRITSFRVDATNGALTSLGDVSTAGMIGSSSYMAAVTHVSVHPSGAWVFAAHFNSGHVTVHATAGTGAATTLTDVERPADEAHQIVSDASGNHVFVPCRAGNVIAQYAFASGQLTPATPPLVQAETGAGPRHIAFHPNQQSAYVINELNGTITSYRYDATAGLLSMPQSMASAPAGMSETSSAHVVVHPSGRFVYTSNRTTNTIGIFSVDASGRLSTIGHETAGGMVRTPRDFGMDPTGRYLIVANQGTNNVIVLRIDATAGTLTRVGDPVSVPASPQFAGAIALPPP